ncbi:hypothetical protein [Streptosporangium sp. NPDC051022]|uniref:hypothetical protein n=1 Tax=Streptosporangium sp. NPDC051022 TaxID=3155752 RepID=UPI00342F80F4
MADTVRATVTLAVTLVVAMGLVAALAVLLLGGGPGGAMATLLDFLLAAGLLRLSQTQTWAAIAVAALTVVIRKVVAAGFLRSRQVVAGGAGPGLRPWRRRSRR